MATEPKIPVAVRRLVLMAENVLSAYPDLDLYAQARPAGARYVIEIRADWAEEVMSLAPVTEERARTMTITDDDLGPILEEFARLGSAARPPTSSSSESGW